MYFQIVKIDGSAVVDHFIQCFQDVILYFIWNKNVSC